MTGDGGLMKVTVNLTEKAVTAMDRCVEVNEENRTDALNRAIQIYAFLSEATADGTELLLRSPDGSLFKVNYDFGL